MDGVESNQASDPSPRLNMQKVKIITRNVGAFGTYGAVTTLRGRQLAECEVRPYGFHSAAREDAADVAKQNGWHVVA
jgi:hypothetical protein